MEEGVPTTKNKFPVGIDVPEFLADLGIAKDAIEVVKAVGDYTLIKFYYLFQVREYTVIVKSNDTKQTVNFKLGYAMFFFRVLRGVCANHQSMHPMRRF